MKDSYTPEGQNHPPTFKKKRTFGTQNITNTGKIKINCNAFHGAML